MDHDMTQRPLAVPALSDRQSLREKIADVLRAAVISGQMQQGVVYSVPTLAAQFEVSATPVREAMLDLAKEGLVEPVRNKGFRVTELTDKDLDDITQLRALIEVPVVAHLALTAAHEDIDALRPLAEAIRDSAETGDLIGYVEADHRFHLGLLALAGNPRLVEVVRDLRAHTRLYGLRKLVEEGRLTDSAAEHSELLDAMVQRDRARTEEVIRRHIGHVRGIWATASGSSRPEPAAAAVETGPAALTGSPPGEGWQAHRRRPGR
jgi:DNA-binding GntR family transcriptional regulator